MSEQTERELFEEWWMKIPVSDFSGVNADHVWQAFQAGRASLPASEWNAAIDAVIALDRADPHGVGFVTRWQLEDLKRQTSEVSENAPTITDDMRKKIQAAIKETEYKYFGDYEFSEKQHDAVDTLVEAARTLLCLTQEKP